MKSLIFVSALCLSSFALACSSAVSPSSSNGNAEALSGAAVSPAAVTAEVALARMKEVAPFSSNDARNSIQKVDPTTLPAALATRFAKAKTPLETFAFAHSDMGDTDSEIVYVLSAPGASTFVGYAVFAIGGDDSDNHSTSAAALYDTKGELLDIQSRSSGISDSEDAGTFVKVPEADRAALASAVRFDAMNRRVQVDGTHVDMAAVPFASFVKKLSTELEGSTEAHSDMGDDVTELLAVKDGNRVIGYVLRAEGGDDSDGWLAAAYATFTADGQLVAREIATDGFADTMDSDSTLLYKR
jgi:hypothetical protein